MEKQKKHPQADNDTLKSLRVYRETEEEMAAEVKKAKNVVSKIKNLIED